MKNKEKNFMSAIIYVYNSENRIEHFLKMVLEVLEDNFEHSEIMREAKTGSRGQLQDRKNGSNVETRSPYQGMRRETQ